ncbi:hypothetical protein RS130_16425 [Paraglaciecola aquimarina]|uniref:Uncharacterized protein n=1 Tax=Paraglaciecola aquimarina TaxID=1235557 RepID=A0ABU3SZ58_9ALTE|nr:hypothetical protein [Paraglaciecola aquimarina]MDU0355281.1 hypothetical protein [Paraglaciecola aquimarina]
MRNEHNRFGYLAKDDLEKGKEVGTHLEGGKHGTSNKHIMFIRSAHWDAYSLALLVPRNYSQQACAPYVKRYVLRDAGMFKCRITKGI